MSVMTVGRRKRSIARAMLKEGTGKITVNKVALDEYFGGLDRAKHHVIEPLLTFSAEEKFDIVVSVSGGGTTGQSGAIRLAISRALASENELWKQTLSQSKMLTRDSRRVERKKVGLRKARKSVQYSKR